jgi:hypothetical protein
MILKFAQMIETGLKTPWVFTIGVVGVWILLWVGIEVLLFDDDVAGAVITGAASGLAFALFYRVVRRHTSRQEE